MEDKYEEFLEKLKNKEPFSFSRFGDGEWSAIFNDRPGGKNCDGHEFFSDMGEALANVLKSKPKYYLGMQRFAREETHPIEIEKFLTENDLQSFPWVNADVWHHASIHDEFNKFFEAIADRHIVLVGPTYLSNIKELPMYSDVRVHENNCWLHKDSYIKEIKQDWIFHKDIVFLFCASMPAKVMIDELYQEYGQWHTFLDMGSVFDPFVGKASRSYHKKIIARLNERL